MKGRTQVLDHFNKQFGWSVTQHLGAFFADTHHI